MIVAEQKVAALQGGVVGERLAERSLLVCVARAFDPAQLERELEQGGAIEAVAGSAADVSLKPQASSYNGSAKGDRI